MRTCSLVSACQQALPHTLHRLLTDPMHCPPACLQDVKPHVHKVDAVGAQTDGSGLAAAFKTALVIPIPPDALAWAAVFGEHAIRDLHSPDWKGREQGLHAIIRCLQSAKFHALHDSNETWDAAYAILARSLK